MNLPVRTALAALTLTIFAAPAFAAPVPALDSSARLIVTVADDSKGENEAIEQEEGKAPEADPSAATGSDPVAGGADGEGTQLEEEKSDSPAAGAVDKPGGADNEATQLEEEKKD